MTPFERQKPLVLPDVPPSHLYFPEVGVTSVVLVTDNELSFEVGLFGLDGMSGAHILQGVEASPFATFVQLPGEGFAIATEGFMSAIDRFPALADPIRKFMLCFLAQVSCTAYAAGKFTIEQRLARWILMCHDRLVGNEIPLVHEFLSMMLGVRRSGVTLAIHGLEGGLAIRADRGCIVMRNRAKLEEIAGGAYGVPEAEYEKIMGQPIRRGLSGAGPGRPLGPPANIIL